MKLIQHILLILSVSNLYADRSFPSIILDTGVSITTNEDHPSLKKKYPIFWAIDNNPESTWVHETGVKPITLTFTFSSPQEIEAIKIINGYAKNKYLYYANNRIKELSVKTKVKNKNYNLKETLSTQSIDFSAPQVNEIQLKAIQITKGNKYNDTCISEIHIYSNSSDLLSPKKSFISISGGGYPSYSLYDNNYNKIIHFEPEEILDAFYIESGNYVAFVHAAEMGMNPGITIVNTKTKKYYTVLENLYILHSVHWNNGSFTGIAYDFKKRSEFSFEEKVNLR